jgi:hypothetical protein
MYIFPKSSIDVSSQPCVATTICGEIYTYRAMRQTHTTPAWPTENQQPSNKSNMACGQFETLSSLVNNPIGLHPMAEINIQHLQPFIRHNTQLH